MNAFPNIPGRSASRRPPTSRKSIPPDDSNAALIEQRRGAIAQMVPADRREETRRAIEDLNLARTNAVYQMIRVGEDPVTAAILARRTREDFLWDAIQAVRKAHEMGETP